MASSDELARGAARAQEAEGRTAAAALPYSAVVEAEYAALDAVLARMDAEQVEDEQKTPSGATS